MSEQANLGLDLLVYIGENAIGGQRGASYEMSAESIDISTKTTGAWKAKIGGAKEWTAECEGVFFFNETGFEAAKTAFRAGTPVLLKFTKRNEPTKGEQGNAIITSIAIDAPYDDAMTYSISFEGAGALESITPGK